ncbi:MAG: hypothetical protein LBS27_06115 [Bifidobacteriaceae bacterium]|jgi:hypothetical protein|nr:hypothetical protein [Bifidobacteriaceae bacterium]
MPGFAHADALRTWKGAKPDGDLTVAGAPIAEFGGGGSGRLEATAEACRTVKPIFRTTARQPTAG